MTLEHQIVGAILIDSSDILDEIDPLMFSDKSLAEIIMTCKLLRENDLPVDMTTVSDRCTAHSDLVYFCSNITTTINATKHVAILKDKYERSLLVQASHDFANKLNTGQDIHESFSELTEVAYSGEKNIDFLNSRQSLDKMIKRCEDISSGKIQAGFGFGFSELDNLDCKIRDGELTILAGRPSYGKTLLGLNIIDRLATVGKRCVLISLEMPVETIMLRRISARCSIDLSKLMNSRLRNDEVKKMMDEVKAMKDHKTQVFAGTNLTVEKLMNMTRAMNRDEKIDVLVIDYLSLLRSAKSFNSRYEEVTEISRLLKVLTIELNVPIVCLAQLNREGDKTNRKPKVSDLRDSGAIEQDADTIILLDRPNFNSADPRDQAQAEIIVGKNRNGQTGGVNAEVIGQYQKIVERG